MNELRAVLRMILEWLKDVKTTPTIGQQDETGKGAERLLSQLTSQRDKKAKGSTPIHLAASLGGWPDAWSLARRFPQVWAGSWWATELLLDANVSTAYQADDEGLYPIHVAAMAGSLGVVLLLQRCPGCVTLRDLRGRTFLHVAVYKKRYIVVKHVCKTPRLASILNAQDSNGDTALHGAVRAGNLAVFNCLLRNRQVRLDVPNRSGMTPLDLARSMIPSGLHYVHNPRLVVRLSLLHAGAPYGGGRAEHFHEKHITKRDVDKESEKYTHATQAMSIVAVLIATVTFASAFTLPGGYRGADGGGDAAAGTAVLAGRRSYAFDAFILADTSAFICSTLATCTLVYAGLPAMDIDIRHKYVDVSSLLLQSSARSFVAAFALGLYLVLAPVDRFIAVAVCVIVFGSSLCGNMGALQITCAANTVRARIGIRRFVVQRYARRMFLLLWVHFGSYILIFGLPAIRKWASSHKMRAS